MAKKFEAHMMYSPDGKSAMAATMEDHLRYKEMGWGHEKTSPLNVTPAPAPSRGWAKLAYGASGSGGTQGGGFGNTGYTVDFTNIDFGKAALADQMKLNEKKKFKKDEEDPNAKDKVKKEEKVVKEKEGLDDIYDNVPEQDMSDYGKVDHSGGEEGSLGEEQEINMPEEEYPEPGENANNEQPQTDLANKGSDVINSNGNQQTKQNTSNSQKLNQGNVVDENFDPKKANNTFKEQKGGNANGGPVVISGFGEDSGYSRSMGGGNYKRNGEQKFTQKNGVITGQKNSGKTKGGKKFDWGFKMKNGTVKFNNAGALKGSKGGDVMKNVIKNLRITNSNDNIGNLPKNGEYTFNKVQWESFTAAYTKEYDRLNNVRTEIDKMSSKSDKIKAIKELKGWEKQILQMHSQGFFANTFSNPSGVNFNSPMKHPIEDVTLSGDGSKVTHRHDEKGKSHWVGKNGKDISKDTLKSLAGGGVNERPFKFNSPFARRDNSHLKVRDSYAPQQSASPMNYSPFHQEQPAQGGTIWDKIKSYGPSMDTKINKFIQHTNYSPDTDKPINSFQNQQWVGVVTEWLQTQKQSMVDATNNNDKKSQQKISASVNQLIQDVTTYSGKFLDWMDRNSGDQEKGNAGGGVVSKGSMKDEKFIGDVTFMGDQNTTIAVGEDGKIGIKSFGLDQVKYIEDLDDNVFAKDDAGYAMFLEASSQLQKDAEAGKPLNENIVKGHSDQLLKNKDSVLSWAFDPLYGSAWIQDFAKANPGQDFDIFMPESKSFDIDYLTDELHGWLGSKLTEAYEKNKPQQPQQKGDAAQGIMNETTASVEEEKKNKEGVYAENGEQPQQPAPEQAMAQAPPAQGSPMGYKKSTSDLATELLRKYSK
tara:strand:+ start:4900 stop:7512 length:2613 start_codon:yes stop_codon:yes gene_type:complete